MTTIQNVSTNDSADNRSEMSIHKDTIPDSMLSFGSVADKYPVILDGGKTIIFISNKNKASRIRKKYEMRMGIGFKKYSKKPKE
jgi:hypothetical protein